MTTTKTGTARENYVEKIRKLLAKAEGASTPEEAETFFAKVEELMAKWEISDAELALACSAADAVSWVIKQRAYVVSSYSPKHDAHAMGMVAKAMGLEAYYEPYIRGVQQGRAVILGTEEDLDRFEMLWAVLSVQMTRFMREAEDPSWNRNEQRRFRLGFKVGFGNRVSQRIAAARDKATSKALVLAGKQDALERARPNILKKVSVRYSAEGAAAGVEAADRADLEGRGRVSAPRSRRAVGA